MSESMALGRVLRERGRGGAHRRSRADEQALVVAVCDFIGRDPGGAASLRELWLAWGYRQEDRRRLEDVHDLLFEVESGVEDLRQKKLAALHNRRPEGRLRAAEWWLKLANAKASRRNEALLCSPVVPGTLERALRKEHDPRVREALTGALAYVVSRHFPAEAQRPLLAELVSNAHSGVRFFAVQGLAGYLGRGEEEGDLASLVDLASDGADGVRYAVAAGLLDSVTSGRVPLERLQAFWPVLEPLTRDSRGDTAALAGELRERMGLGSAGDAR